jgi:hypothetical protein
MLDHTWINPPVSCALQERIRPYPPTLALLVLLALLESQQLAQLQVAFPSLLAPFVHQAMQDRSLALVQVTLLDALFAALESTPLLVHRLAPTVQLAHGAQRLD